MIQKSELANRLNQLGWKPFHLAKQVSLLRSKRGDVTSAARINSTVAKAVDNPIKSVLSTLSDVVAAMDGELTITWGGVKSPQKYNYSNCLQECQLIDRTGVIGVECYPTIPAVNDYILFKYQYYLVVERVIKPVTDMPSLVLFVIKQDIENDVLDDWRKN